MSAPFRVPDPPPPKAAPTPPPPPVMLLNWGQTTTTWPVATEADEDEPLPVGYLLAGETLPARVTASMWVEAKGHTPAAALSGLRREVDRWRTAEGWDLDDGKLSVSGWDGTFVAQAVVTKAVDW